MSFLDEELIHASQPDAVVREFESLQAWTAFAEAMKVYDRPHMRAMVEHARRAGIVGLHTGPVARPNVIDYADGIHWDIVASGLDMRSRAVLDIIAASPFAKARQLSRIYCAEALSPLAMELRGCYPRCICSQYMPDPQAQHENYPIQHQDLMGLTLPSESFDIVVSIEVLEHIWDLPQALREQARVLRPGGVMLATFPFGWTEQETLQKAVLDRGKVRHLVAEPEYHGDSMRADGILVYQIPGWDIVDTARAAGFKRAAFTYYSTATGGIIGHDLLGQFVFVAYK